MPRRNILVALALMCATGVPATILAAECVGRCEGPGGAAAVVSAGTCDAATESCHAGCDTKNEAGPRPYAECIGLGSGRAVQRPDVVPSDAKRE